MAVASARVVLGGGRSSRTGAPKAALEWHGSTLLRRTAEIVARAVNGPVVVVRALVMEDLLRPTFLFEQCPVRTLDDDALRLDPVLAALDPNLDSVLKRQHARRLRGGEQITSDGTTPLAGDTVCFMSADSEG